MAVSRNKLKKSWPDLKFILHHNHPSGSIEPSDADNDFTERMIKTGQLLKIEVVDHVVISEKKFFSVCDDGLIEKLKETGRYEILEAEEESMKKFKLEMEIIKASNESK